MKKTICHSALLINYMFMASMMLRGWRGFAAKSDSRRRHFHVGMSRSTGKDAEPRAALSQKLYVDQDLDGPSLETAHHHAFALQHGNLLMAMASVPLSKQGKGGSFDCLVICRKNQRTILSIGSR